MIHVHTVPVGMFQSNCVIVRCGRTGRGLLVDPGDDADVILHRVGDLLDGVDAIVATHGHLDHVGALPEVVAALGAPVAMHRAERPVYESLERQAAMFGLRAPGRVTVDRWLEDGDEVAFGDARATILHAPGHSPGSACLWLPDADPPSLVAGDVLFLGSIGRTDLPGGDHAAMLRTLRGVIARLPDGTRVVPGHGPATTIGAEKRSNPFLAPLCRGGG